MWIVTCLCTWFVFKRMVLMPAFLTTLPTAEWLYSIILRSKQQTWTNNCFTDRSRRWYKRCGCISGRYLPRFGDVNIKERVISWDIMISRQDLMYLFWLSYVETKEIFICRGGQNISWFVEACPSQNRISFSVTSNVLDGQVGISWTILNSKNFNRLTSIKVTASRSGKEMGPIDFPSNMTPMTCSETNDTDLQCSCRRKSDSSIPI